MDTLEIAGYIPRIADRIIAESMEAFGGVVIEGPKWCGKTTTAKSHAVSEASMADPTGDFQSRRLAEMEPALCARRPETPIDRRVAGRAENMGRGALRISIGRG